ncbi:hypothetical protein BKA81DRAFT_408680 [Phyllosticta paracitricarpa]
MSYTLTSYRYLHSRVALFEELAIEMYFGLRPFDGLTREERTFVFEQLGLLARDVNRVTPSWPKNRDLDKYEAQHNKNKPFENLVCALYIADNGILNEKEIQSLVDRLLLLIDEVKQLDLKLCERMAKDINSGIHEATEMAHGEFVYAKMTINSVKAAAATDIDLDVDE